ncbi:TetR/AcrR family transcriptional regulator [Yinghuangia soli]|uniref:TetR/AcrR family transcriptional regulator n=1 Tax=Yinghuangia soli TaxID=2908204 RepID=A0AA41PZD5_9ACTN|nr:TetR/AcrR family transcriptional regulator [Yinghuangia soli]MCF2528724.1 TetR/AcrR family transcriptional regulator [Yinghuangia soli]
MTNDPASAPEQILAAATELFHERSPAAVSLREIARRAEVNYGLIHHYFKSKEAVLGEVFRASAQQGGRLVADAPDSATALARLAQDPRAFARMLAWAVLDSDTSQVFAHSSPAMRHIADLIAAEWASAPAATPPAAEPPAHDPRVVAATSVLTLLGWSLFAPYVFPAAGLEDRDEDDVRTEVLALLAKMTTAAAPPAPRGTADA